jgi:3-hydroxyisobutyrate dehydrogenase
VRSLRLAGVRRPRLDRRARDVVGSVARILNASTGRNYATEHKLAQFVLSRRFDAGFSLALMVKDLGNALELAGDTATPAAFARECHASWTRAAEALEPGADHTAVVRWLETLAGTTLGES